MRERGMTCHNGLLFTKALLLGSLLAVDERKSSAFTFPVSHV